MSTKAKQWEAVRRELETKVTSLQDELSGMRKWCLAALGEAEKRTAELRSQNAATQRQLVEETQRKIEAIQAAEANLHKLQEEKKLKLMVYGQTLTKHKEMAEEAVWRRCFRNASANHREMWAGQEKHTVQRNTNVGVIESHFESHSKIDS